MNELLGWYGYDKVELKDGEDIEFRSYPTDGESRQHISVLKENSLPKPKLPEDSVISSYNMSAGYSGLATGNGLSDSPAGSKDHGNVPIIVPLIPPPFIKPPAEDDVSNVQIMCAWCQKVGIKRYSLSMGSEVKSFCSEKCFAACRRAYFKRNKYPFRIGIFPVSDSQFLPEPGSSLTTGPLRVSTWKVMISPEERGHQCGYCPVPVELYLDRDTAVEVGTP
ncbi:hypothetical protein STEG23_028891 [Scotinomys teguina]